MKRVIGVQQLATLLVAMTLWALAGTAAALEPREGWYPHLVDRAFVEQHAVLPKPDGVMIIDARPARKYDESHIPTAVNIPDLMAEKMTDKLPADKNTLLIYYCGGVECMLSHKSAFKAQALGYTNIKVYAEGDPDWKAAGKMMSIGLAAVKKIVDGSDPALLIDSRPKERKYDKGHIPTAISIPDLHFDKMKDKLPADKAARIVFYCEGPACKLSDNSAHKAKALGYTNVWTYVGGFPEWKDAGLPVSTAAAAAGPAIKQGKDSGTISIDSFKEIADQQPDSVLFVDVRDAPEFKKGSMRGAVNIPIGELEKRVGELPADKPVIFICSTGGRSGEAHDLVKLLRSEVKSYFLDAELTFKNGGYQVKAH